MWPEIPDNYKEIFAETTEVPEKPSAEDIQKAWVTLSEVLLIAGQVNDLAIALQILKKDSNLSETQKAIIKQYAAVTNCCNSDMQCLLDKLKRDHEANKIKFSK